MQSNHVCSVVLWLQYRFNCSCSEVLCVWIYRRVTDLFRATTSWQISEARNQGTDSECVGCSCTQGRCDIVTTPGQARTCAYELCTWCGQIICWRTRSTSLICKFHYCFNKSWYHWGLAHLFCYVWTLETYLFINWWSLFHDMYSIC